MSLVASALRISAVEALKASNTLAGARVFDSVLLPIPDMQSEAAAPFISVATEEESETPAGRDLFTGSRQITMVIDMGLGRSISLPGTGDEGDVETFTISETDAHLEIALSILGRQVYACLFGAGGGDWGEIFRGIVSSIKQVDTRRGVPEAKGIRFAARSIIADLGVCAEPAFGRVPEPDRPFGRFLAHAEATPLVANLGRILRHAAQGVPLDWPEHYTPGAVWAGLTEAEADAIGVRIHADETTEIVIEDEDTNGDVVIEEEEAP